jgi:hypothetical protein
MIVGGLLVSRAQRFTPVDPAFRRGCRPANRLAPPVWMLVA